MKKRIRKAGILLVVFVAAIFVSSLFMNSGVDDQIIDLGDPTLPRISFQKEGRTVNALAGYVNEMDVTAMRDTITPLEANGTLQMQIEEFGNKITGVEYKVYSLNGEETYLEGKQKDISDETILLDLKKGLPDEVSEAVLEVILSMEEQAHFYTRITRPDELSLKECLDFAQKFHDAAADTTLDTAADEYGYTVSTGTFSSDNTTLDEEVLNALEGLKSEGELSDVVETDNYYYVLRLDEITDADATEEHRQEIISQRQSDLYNEVLQGWKDEAEWVLKDKVWDKVTFDNLFTTTVESTETTETTESSTTDNAVTENTEAVEGTESVQ